MINLAYNNEHICYEYYEYDDNRHMSVEKINFNVFWHARPILPQQNEAVSLDYVLYIRVMLPRNR